MAKYQNYIDQFLEDYMPDYEEVGLGPAAESGKEQLSRTHDYVDEDFLEGLSDDTNQHTQGPRGGKGTRTGSQQAADRAEAKEAAFPRVRASMVINRTAGALSDESLFSEVTMDIEAAKNHGKVEKREVSNEEVQRYLRRMLNDGVPPVKIAAQLGKLAEVLDFNRGMATDYLNRNAGQLGLAYIQPNEFMDKCPNTYERLKVKAASEGRTIQAKSVKQLNACQGCVFFHKAGSSKTCNLYKLPIVGNQNELLTVVNKMTPGVPTGSKKLALLKIANREDQRTQTVQHVVSSRPVQKVHNTSPDAMRLANQRKEVDFTPADYERYHLAGNPLEKIYNFAVKKVGSAKASKSVREFINGLKTAGTKVALSQIDCTFLKQKLGVQNAIIGAVKCSSCTYRKGMHCGLTGGTLVSFPGMEKQASNHKIGENAPKDGRAMLKEFDLTASAEMPDIEISASGPDRSEVQMGNVASMGDIE